MSCCDDIILRMRPDVAPPGAFTAELSDGSLVTFDRAYMEHAGADAVELLQAGLMPQEFIDDYRALLHTQRPADGDGEGAAEHPVLTWPA